MTEIKKIVLSGGGTGGHIYPALSLYKELKKKYPDAEALYIGSSKGLESDIVKREGIPFKSVEIQGLRRSFSLDNLKTLWLMLSATSKAKKILKEFKPDVVVGTGGFVCAPVLFGATKLKIPTVIHEQNSVAGVTNKFLSRFVSKIAICFEDVRQDFDKVANKVVLTGNPRGQEVIHAQTDAKLWQQFGLNPSLPTVLVFGGSRGAPAINNAAIASIPAFAKQSYQVIIVTGQQHFDALNARAHEFVAQWPTTIKIVPYINNMPGILKNVDLVVCRSGATTLTELTALGITSVLIPSPFVTNNHQEHNAQALVERHAAKMILQSELTDTTLVDTINAIMNSEAELNAMSQNTREMGIRNATDRLIEVVESVVK